MIVANRFRTMALLAAELVRAVAAEAFDPRTMLLVKGQIVVLTVLASAELYRERFLQFLKHIQTERI